MFRFLKPSQFLNVLILLHEAAFLFLVVVTGLLGGMSAYFWHRHASEIGRVNTLLYLNEQIRADLYAQIQGAIRARILEDQNALMFYLTQSRRIDSRFNFLRQHADLQQEGMAIQALQFTYRQLQKDMNQIFNDPYMKGDASRLQIIDSNFFRLIINRFEKRYSELRDLLENEHVMLNESLESWTRFAPIIIFVTLILAVLLVLYTRLTVNKRLLRPMSRVISGADAISRGELNYRIKETHGVVEVSNLVASVNNMAQTIEQSQAELIERETQAALGTLVPVVAHNIRNPLSSIRASAQMIGEHDSREELQASRDMIIQTIDRLGRWVSALVSYLHPLKPNIRNVQAVELFEVSINLLQNKINAKAVTLVKNGWELDHSLEADPDLIEQALCCLIANAIDATPKESQIELRLSQREEYLQFHIIDSGHGLPFKPRVDRLEPGPSTKRFGTGLGIPIAFKIFQNHGWSIQFKTLEENLDEGSNGTEVVIAAPISLIKRRT